MMYLAPLLLILATVPGPLATSGSGVVPSPKWTVIGKTDSTEFAFDANSIETTQDGYKRVQLRQRFRADTPAGRERRERMTSQTTAALEGRPVRAVASGVMVVEVNCTTGQFRNRAQTLFDDDGGVIESVPGENDPEWQKPGGGSANEAVVHAACSQSSGE